jgi:hypothetical protein
MTSREVIARHRDAGRRFQAGGVGSFGSRRAPLPS